MTKIILLPLSWLFVGIGMSLIAPGCMILDFSNWLHGRAGGETWRHPA